MKNDIETKIICAAFDRRHSHVHQTYSIFIMIMSWYRRQDYDDKCLVHTPHMQPLCDKLDRTQATNIQYYLVALSDIFREYRLPLTPTCYRQTRQHTAACDA